MQRRSRLEDTQVVAGRSNLREAVAFGLIITLLAFIMLCGAMVANSHARTKYNGQTLYVPAYSYIYHGNRNATINLTTTISVRNTSRVDTIRITSVEYFDTDGKLIRSYLKEPIVMTPLQSLKYVVKLDDDKGGSGANFIVVWKADKAVDEPLIEAVMVGTGASFGFAFLTQAVEIE